MVVEFFGIVVVAVALEPTMHGGTIARITLPYHTSDDLRVTEEVALP